MTVDLAMMAEKLTGLVPSECRVVTGFDGFVDEMISVVGERRALDDYSPVRDIGTFGSLISSAAGQNSLREIVINDVHPGGCAVNLADGLASLGVGVDCFATSGDPMHPAFGEVAQKCRGFHSWGCDPGRTLAFEFNDGKLMFSAVRQLAGFTPSAVRGFIADGRFTAACAGAQVIALTDWTLYPHMTEVWKMLQKEVFSTLTHRPDFFFDLVDPSSRSEKDISGMTAALRDFQPVGNVTLGLNGNEANVLCRLYELAGVASDPTPQATLRQAAALRDILGIHRVVVHRIRFAVSASASDEGVQAGPYCPNPKRSTGAGDRFNAGFCLGLAHGMNDMESLVLGCAVAGFFVRHARSANHHELIGFLRNWENVS